jgi:orotidine-5'-phosphate decarboxylase
MQASDRLIVAADLSARDEILALADEMHGVAFAIKIGLQAFIANGPALVRDVVAREERVFLDLKIHDIPNSAQHAVAEAARLGVSMLTIHTSGGEAMLRACVASVSTPAPLLLGVTVLTSLDDGELSRIGFRGTALENAVRLAKMARSAGLRGVVASPLETRAIRDACGPDLVIVTPGIRTSGDDAGDQRRTLSPREAVARGADYIVVGRPITSAKNRRDAAQRIVEEISVSSRV